MTTRVLGLDLSATKAGLAAPTGRLSTLVAPKIDTAKHGTAEIGRRLWWWHRTLTDLLVKIYQPQIVVIEGAFVHRSGTGTLRVAEVHGVARCAIHRAGATLIEVAPAELKKWATGNGNAPKDDMIAAAIQRGGAPANDDEADAFLLRAWALETIPGPDEALRRWLTH